MHRVFLYGTLKKGQPNHHHMLAWIQAGECVFEGTGVTETKYPLVVESLFKIPFLLDAPDAHNAVNVEGEVYSVNDKILDNLDNIERHPTFYTRLQIPIIIDGKTEEIWCYLMQNFRKDFLQLPVHKKYDSRDFPPFMDGAKKPPTEEERRKFMAYIKESL